MTTLSLSEVASRLGKSPRWLRDWLRGKTYGRLIGRSRRFTEKDYQAILEAFRCPLSSLRPKQAARLTSAFGERTAVDILTVALELAAEKSRRKSSQNGKTNASGKVIPLPVRQPSPGRP